jgi:hypothetical protein
LSAGKKLKTSNPVINIPIDKMQVAMVIPLNCPIEYGYFFMSLFSLSGGQDLENIQHVQRVK